MALPPVDLTGYASEPNDSATGNRQYMLPVKLPDGTIIFILVPDFETWHGGDMTGQEFGLNLVTDGHYQ